MILHFHNTIVPNSGELKRMKNIDKEFTTLLNTKSIEVVSYPNSRRAFVQSQEKFTLSVNVQKKLYVRTYPIPYLTTIWLNIYYLHLCLKYKPSFVIGEMRFPYKLLWLMRKMCPKTKMVFDIHGAIAEEAEYQGASKERVERFRAIEQKELSFVDYVICQSSEMKRYIEKHYAIASDEICVYRCGVDTGLFAYSTSDRESIRKELGIDNETILFVYSGGLHPWQRVSDSISIFKIFNESNSKSKMLVLTGDQDGLQNILKEQGMIEQETIISCSLPFSMVPTYLNACDVAFLLRDNHTMNAVASPTKLGEYMACGLMVITSKVAASWVDEKGTDYFIFEESIGDDMSLIVDKLAKLNKQDIVTYAKNNLSLTIDQKSLKEFLSVINK